MTPPVDTAALAARALERDPASVARAISLVEDRRPEAESQAIALLTELSVRGRAESCQRVGITGPPGVGKSTLGSALIRRWRGAGRSVGVLAVDPSSPRSGGALLGDRARIELDPDDDGVFVRSMASGGQLGGLARAAGAAVEVLSAVFDVVLIETVGVGQSETDIEHVADTVLLVVQPASGDVLQFIKAGILEIPDVLAVNKSDLGAVAERALAELTGALRLCTEPGGLAPPPLVLTSASGGHGVDQLVLALDGHFSALRQSGRLGELRLDKSTAWAARLFAQRHGELGVERVGGPALLRTALTRELRQRATLIEAVRNVAARLA